MLVSVNGSGPESLLAQELIDELPETRAIRLYPELQATAIGQLYAGLAGLGATAFYVC